MSRCWSVLPRVLVMGLVVAMPLMSCRKAPEPTPVCTFTITPPAHTVTADGGTRSVVVTASAASCGWTAAANVPWIGLPAGSAGTGSATLDYIAAPNPATDPRTGHVVIGGQTHVVTQEGRTPEPPPPACTYQLTPESATVDAGGGTGSVQVTAPDGCSWAAVSNDTWLTIDAGGQGNGGGAVAYRAASFAGIGERTGTISIADQTFTVRQRGFDVASCEYTVAPVEFTPCLTAGSITTRVSTTADCPWTVSTPAGWLSISGGGTQIGSGDVVASYSSNYAAPREGVIEVRWPTVTAGQNVRVAQAGCLYATTVSVIAIGAAGGAVSFTVMQQAMPNSCGGPLQDACIWSATTSSSFVTITTPMPRAGDNPVNVSVAANTSTQARTATIVVQDRSVVIEQAGAP
jgi:hypothetical protein